MRTSELIDCVGRLERATQRLHDAWTETRKTWDDAVADDFEKRHLDPLLPQLKLTLASIYQLAETFDKVSRACDDPDTLPAD